MGPVDHLLGKLLEVETPLEIVVVAGRNEELRQRLERVTPPRAIGWSLSVSPTKWTSGWRWPTWSSQNREG